MKRSETKRLVILGGGESGVGAAILANVQGLDVFLSDASEIKKKYKDELEELQIPFEEKGHTKELILNADEVVKSPGIPDSAPIVKDLLSENIPVISEIEFASRYTDAKLIGVTGSNGKTTTVSLLYHILLSAGLKVGLAGNVGTSFARLVSENLYDYYVLEISSFQLEGVYDFKADIAVILNITPDHLDRYDNEMNGYIDAKMRIFRNLTLGDSVIYWLDDPIISKEIERLEPISNIYTFSQKADHSVAAYIEDNKIWFNPKGDSFDMELELLSLEGMHNVYNTMASGLVAKLLDISDKNLRQALADFKGVPHRLEKVATVRGVSYVNDSKATNVNSCWYALQSIRSKVVLILGGVDKGNDYKEIADLVKEKVRALIFLGRDNQKLHNFFDGMVETIVDVDNMEDAVKKAYEIANKGDTVLLSPATASFDLFEDYEDRGNQFKVAVRNL